MMYGVDDDQIKMEYDTLSSYSLKYDVNLGSELFWHYSPI